MPVRLRWVFSIAVIAALAVAPAPARATLVFTRGTVKQSVWVAEDDGSHQKRLARGSNPHVSPDGQTVAYMRIHLRGRFRPDLMVVAADRASAPRRLVSGWWDPFTFAWSPDSGAIALVRGPELGRKRLVLIDVAMGTQRTVAEGYFSGVSFSPDGSELIYGRAASERYPVRSDIYRFDVPIGESLRYVPPVRLTHDHRSLNPLWGPDGQIAFARQLGAKRRRYGPKNELFLMTSQGTHVRRLTHTKVDPLLVGLTPTDWSADGRRLLAEFGGQDTSYAVRVNPRTGAQRPVRSPSRFTSLIGWALSADGTTILASSGSFEPGRNDKVVGIPYGGGHARVLVRRASEPDWNR